LDDQHHCHFALHRDAKSGRAAEVLSGAVTLMEMCDKTFARQMSGKILLDKTCHAFKFDGHAIYNLHYYN
jgi:hypothetical protein